MQSSIQPVDGALKARAEYKGRVARLTASLRQ
jgi:hypothetical protein